MKLTSKIMLAVVMVFSVAMCNAASPTTTLLKTRASYTAAITTGKWQSNFYKAKKYATEPVRQIYAETVKEGDSLKTWIEDGKKRFTFQKDPFSSGKIIGCIAVCVYEDEHIDYELLSISDLENIRKQSKARNSLAWSTFTEEMYKKAAIRRLCKRLTLDMDAETSAAFDSGLELERDQKELAKRDIAEHENSEAFEGFTESEVV